MYGTNIVVFIFYVIKNITNRINYTYFVILIILSGEFYLRIMKF